MSGAKKLKLRVVDHLPVLYGEPRSLLILKRLEQVQHYGKVGQEFNLSRQRIHQIANRYGFRLYRIMHAAEAAEKITPLLERLKHPKPCLHCGNEVPRSKDGALCGACVRRFREIGRIRYFLKRFQESPGRNRWFSTQALSVIKRFGVRPEEI